MKSTLERVEEFHVAFNQGDPVEPTIPATTVEDAEALKQFSKQMTVVAEACLAAAKVSGNKSFMRLHLIQEELAELAEGLANADLVECLDALTDLQYVVDGTYAALGLGPVKEVAFDEVHRSNMSKLGEDGKPILDGGRVLKGPNYFKPNLGQFLVGDAR